jgi:hypothetical protein
MHEALAKAQRETPGEKPQEALAEAPGEALGEALREALRKALCKTLCKARRETPGGALHEVLPKAPREVLCKSLGEALLDICATKTPSFLEAALFSKPQGRGSSRHEALAPVWSNSLLLLSRLRPGHFRPSIIPKVDIISTQSNSASWSKCEPPSTKVSRHPCHVWVVVGCCAFNVGEGG